MRKRSKKQSKSKLPILLTFLLILLLGAGGYVLIVFFEGEKPLITLHSNLEYMGSKSKIEFSASDSKSGLKSVQATLSQGELSKVILSEKYEKITDSSALNAPPREFSIDVAPKKLGFKDGAINLTVEAADHSMREMFKGNTTTTTKNIKLDTVALKINILHSESYIQPGGTGIIIYRLSGAPSNFGMNLHGKINPGFPLGDGRDDVYITYFGLPYDSEDFSNATIFAEDKAGNRTAAPVSSIFKAANFKKDRINVGDGFLKAKIPEFQQHYPEMEGSMVEKYIYANNKVRQQNNKSIAEICSSSHSERLWEGQFLRMAGSSKAGFADHRTYYYAGKPIDKQVHLGMDIASTKRVGIKAANGAIVVYADYLGIYGNMIILDHGQGVFSLYSHLSQINVAIGYKVEKGFVIGQSGISGMAGGDHLHFSMLINGVFVTPKEWWDPHWIAVTIDEPIVDSKF